MAVPKKRTSKSRKNMRRSHHFVTAKSTIVCPSCGEAIMRHRACGACGQYRGREIVKVQADA